MSLQILTLAFSTRAFPQRKCTSSVLAGDLSSCNTIYTFYTLKVHPGNNSIAGWNDLFTFCCNLSGVDEQFSNGPSRFSLANIFSYHGRHCSRNVRIWEKPARLIWRLLINSGKYQLQYFSLQRIMTKYSFSYNERLFPKI